MQHSFRPKIGLALSGSGDRSTFYIGFLERLKELNVPIDYITACSGGSLVASAYACGTLANFKKLALSLTDESLKSFLVKGKTRGGLYSLDIVEERLREFTGGKTFEEVRPIMSFITVDIETGEQIYLCMGDIAKAARISCTLPGAFEPVKWGSRTLVDGGLLSFIPLDELKRFPVDITIGVNMRGTRHIFTQRQINLKKVLNILGRVLFVGEMKGLVKGLIENEDEEINFEKNPRTISVLNKSLNLAIAAQKTDGQADLSCDLMIAPKVPRVGKNLLDHLAPYYEIGRRCAEENAPKILELIKAKEKIAEKAP